MNFLRLGFTIVSLLLSLSLSAQVFDVNDPIVDYDEANPPSNPSTGQIAKWVRTPGVSWNTNQWKCYVLNGMAFRLRFPNNYDPNRAEEYPIILILHGLGFSNGDKYMNERHLNNSGARPMKMRLIKENMMVLYCLLSLTMVGLVSLI
ncbi:hypothetical protein [Reichenbachiella ulvae]|uniref:Uncharacterized protein n=1 Tax=Reichenbachiella ulvae TaxID=2980104 RepID=A0ABT3CMX7_9BACT|nr:hypothetical protein [Reichenbachiella ulvae]MCV9385030.1 hypothetical protein [Reichenbachiella ulvae]